MLSLLISGNLSNLEKSSNELPTLDIILCWDSTRSKFYLEIYRNKNRKKDFLRRKEGNENFKP